MDFVSKCSLVLVALSVMCVGYVASDESTVGRELALICDTNTSHPDSAFVRNFVNAINSVFREAETSGSVFRVEGNGNSSTVYMFLECEKDLPESDRKTCVTAARVDIQGCKPILDGTRSGRVYMDACYLRYDDHDFRNETVSMGDKTVCGNGTVAPALGQFGYEFLTNVSTEASSRGGFYVADVVYGNRTFHGLAQCWQYVATSSCQSCLKARAAEAMTCLPRHEGVVLSGNCILKYAISMTEARASHSHANQNYKIGVSRVILELVLVSLGLLFGLLF